MSNTLTEIPICSVTFSGYLKKYEQIPVIAAFSVADLIRGICCYYPEFQGDIWNLSSTGKKFIIKINDEFYISNVEDTHVLLPYHTNKIEICCADSLQGESTGWLLGIGLIAAAFTGVGFLGLSSTALGLLGASLVASSIFKAPKVNTKERTDKRSNNFTGTINTTGGGQPLPLVFGDGWIGSIVASASISPEERSVS